MVAPATTPESLVSLRGTTTCVVGVVPDRVDVERGIGTYTEVSSCF
jgi:hypothetical protein